MSMTEKERLEKRMRELEEQNEKYYDKIDFYDDMGNWQRSDELLKLIRSNDEQIMKLALLKRDLK